MNPLLSPMSRDGLSSFRQSVEDNAARIMGEQIPFMMPDGRVVLGTAGNPPQGGVPASPSRPQPRQDFSFLSPAPLERAAMIQPGHGMEEADRRGFVSPETWDRPLSRFAPETDALPPEFRRESPVAPAPAPARPSVPLPPQRERIPLPPPRPAEFNQAREQAGSILGGLFKDPYAGMSSQQMFERLNEMGERPGSAQLFMRAAARQAEEARAEKDAAGKAMGGSVEKPGAYASGGNSSSGSGSVNAKDAALMKALEIIHHMVTRG